MRFFSFIKKTTLFEFVSFLQKFIIHNPLGVGLPAYIALPRPSTKNPSTPTRFQRVGKWGARFQRASERSAKTGQGLPIPPAK
jgi:hypothetical protein